MAGAYKTGNKKLDDILAAFKVDINMHNSALYMAIADQMNELEYSVQESDRDELTGLYLRREAYRELNEHIDLSERHGHHLSIAMADIDHFKDYNDAYGHKQGDAALKTISKVMEASMRRSDLVARIGGEEFLIIMPETDNKQAIDTLRRLRKTVEATLIPISPALTREDGSLRVELPDEGYRCRTISIGLVTYHSGLDYMLGFLEGATNKADVLVDLADKALYEAKGPKVPAIGDRTAYRNRVCCYDPLKKAKNIIKK